MNPFNLTDAQAKEFIADILERSLTANPARIWGDTLKSLPLQKNEIAKRYAKGVKTLYAHANQNAIKPRNFYQAMAEETQAAMEKLAYWLIFSNMMQMETILEEAKPEVAFFMDREKQLAKEKGTPESYILWLQFHISSIENEQSSKPQDH